MATSWVVKKPFTMEEDGGKVNILGIELIVHEMRLNKGREFCVVDVKALLTDVETDERMMTLMIENEKIDIINPDMYRFTFIQYAKEIVTEQMKEIINAAKLTDVFG